MEMFLELVLDCLALSTTFALELDLFVIRDCLKLFTLSAIESLKKHLSIPIMQSQMLDPPKE